jgi:general stress protein 26
MSKKSLAEIAEKMAGIDIAILSTHTEGGEIANRPMSNNGDVTYDGTSYCFTYEKARTVSDIQRHPKVVLGFSSGRGIFSYGIYVAVEGTAELIRDKAAFSAALDERARQVVRQRRGHAWDRANQGGL